MTAQILLHERTSRQIEAYVTNPTHALMIIGQPGAGKTAAARHIASKMFGVPEAKLDDQPHFVRLDIPSGKSEIPIDSVRELIKSLKLKTAGRLRIVLVDKAEALSEEAQNALLKAIEEPPQATYFILCVPTEKSVLPTIASRSQKLIILPASREESVVFFKNGAEEKNIISAWSLSRGAAGLMSALLKDESGHHLKQAVDEAKEFLRKDRFQRITYLDSLSGDKQKLGEFLDGLARVLAALSAGAAGRQQKPMLNKFSAARRRVVHAQDNLDKNVSARLICLDLALGLPL